MVTYVAKLVMLLEFDINFFDFNLFKRYVTTSDVLGLNWFYV